MNISRNKWSMGSLKFWIIGASMVVIIAGLKQASDLVTLILISLLLTSIFLAPFDWLKSKGVHEVLALIIIIISLLSITTLVILLLGSSTTNFSQKLPFYQQRFTESTEAITQWSMQQGLIDSNFNLMGELNPGKIMSLAASVFTGFGNLLSNSFLILFIFIFMMLEVTSLHKKLNVIAPHTWDGISQVIHSLKKYFGIKALTSLATGILVSVGLLIIGVDFPLLWGALAFLLNFIPNIGSIIAAIPAVFLAFIQLNPIAGIFTAALYLVINFVIGNMVEPPLMGRNLGLSSLVVFLSLIFWGWILGTVGMLIATPLTMTLKIILDNGKNTRNFGVILGDESSIKKLQ